MSGATIVQNIDNKILDKIHLAITEKEANRKIYFNFRSLEDSELNLDMQFWRLFYVDGLFDL
jgi:predicted DNA-binding transcriptional regulator YafY